MTDLTLPFDLHKHVGQILLNMQQQMEALALWQQHAPSAEAMASKMPFACDAMSFENWLQFIFIPRLNSIIEAKATLPTKIAIAPMAAHVWQSNIEYQPLIKILLQLDTLFNDGK